MPRIARRVIPGTIVHVIVRFIRGEAVLTDEAGRAEYRFRLERALRTCDWILLSYAQMSTHVHLCFLVGEDPFEQWARSVHSGFARWVNARGRRTPRAFGPVLGERPTTIHVPRSRVAWLIAYHHNNPPRAGVTASAEESTWTSHRFFVGLEPPPAFLHVETALELCGFGADEEGRAAFGRWVALRRGDPTDPVLEGDLREPVRRVRRLHGAAVDLTTPTYTDDGLRFPLLDAGDEVVAPDFDGDPSRVLRAVAASLDVEPERLSSDRRDQLTSLGRRVAVVLWSELGRAPSEMAAALRVSRPAVSLIRRRAQDDEAVRELVRVARARLGTGELLEAG